jgi:hypothetical protein
MTVVVRVLTAVVTLGLLSVVTGCPMPDGPDAGSGPSYPLDGELRLDHVQVKGTHNSYHLRPSEEAPLPWDYDMPLIYDQLDLFGVRQIELDFQYDADANTFRVFHAALVDPVSTCETLALCLGEVARWSDAHPGHLPVWVLLEVKNSETDDVTSDPDTFIARFEQQIEDALGRDRVLTPADVKGEAPTLQEAVEGGWPTLGAVRNKVMLVMWDTGPFSTRYSHGDSHLDDRLMFVRGRTEFGFGVFTKEDDLGEEGALSRAANDISRGFLVRTRADTDGREARDGDLSRFEQALESGCHMISTDFPRGTEHEGYVIDMPEGAPARCNPVTAPAACTSADLERLD